MTCLFNDMMSVNPGVNQTVSFDSGRCLGRTAKKSTGHTLVKNRKPYFFALTLGRQPVAFMCDPEASINGNWKLA